MSKNKKIFEDPVPKPEPKYLLKNEECLDRDEEIKPKEPCSVFLKSYISKRMKEISIKETEKTGKESSRILESIELDILSKIKSNNLLVSKSVDNINTIIPEKKSKSVSSNFSLKKLIDDSIKSKALQEKTSTKQSLENKLKSLEANILILENKNSSDPQNVIENNIRLSKLKEIKSIKDNLEQKVRSVDQQINELLVKEYKGTGLNVKQYLENFEKDKKECEKVVGNINEREEMRERKLKEKLKKIEDKQQEEHMRLKTEEKEKLNKRRMDHNEISKKWSERNLKTKQDLEEHLSLLHEKIPNEYFYNKASRQYLDKQHEEEESKRINEDKFKSDRKALFMPIRLEQINVHSKDVTQKKNELLSKFKKERLLKNEEIKHVNNQMTQKNDVTKSYQDIVKEVREQREKIEKEKLEHQYSNLKKKKYSTIVAENILPVIDELKRKEIEGRVEKLMNPKSTIKKHHMDKSKQVKLVKFTEDSKKKYKWDVDLKKSAEKLRALSPKKKVLNPRLVLGGLSGKSEISKIFHTDDGIDLNHDSVILGSEKSKIFKRKPLEKNPDYLTVMRKENEKEKEKMLTEEEANDKFKQKWEKIMNKNNNIYSTIEDVKSRTRALEEKMNYKEKFMKLNGGAGNHPELGAEVSKLLTDSIQAKILLLQKMND